MKRALNYSGGAVMFAGMITSAQVIIESGFIPDVMSGVSSGAMLLPIIVAALEETELWAQAIEVANNVQPKDYFPGWDDLPVGPKGNLSIHGVLRAATGHPNLGEQDIRGLYKSVFKEHHFEIFKRSSIECYVYGVDYDSGNMMEYKLNDAKDVDDLIDMLQASNRIPIFTQCKNYRGIRHYDGGMRSHNPGKYILRKYPELDECISVFAREDRDHVGTDTNWDKDLITVITRTIGITTTQISVNDEEIQSLLCELNNIKYIPIHLPADMLDEMYDNDSEEVTAFSKASAELAQSILNTDHMA